MRELENLRTYVSQALSLLLLCNLAFVSRGSTGVAFMCYTHYLKGISRSTLEQTS